MSVKLWIFGAVALLIVGITAVALKYRGDAIAAEADKARLTVELQTAVTLNGEKDNTIALLERLKTIDNKVLADLRNGVAALTTEQQETTAALEELGNTNAGVQTVLDTPYPDELKRLLNK